MLFSYLQTRERSVVSGPKAEIEEGSPSLLESGEKYTGGGSR